TEVGGAQVSALAHIIAGNLRGAVSGLANGEYSFYGVVGSTQVEVTSAGHITQVHDIVVSQNTRDDFALAPLVSSDDVSGIWTMTISPSASCPAGAPPQISGRSYTL